MTTNQPIWTRVANLGDVNPLEYGGVFVYVDATGVYAPEVEKLEAPEDDTGTWELYRVVLEPCTFVNGILSDNRFHPDFPVWFAHKLASVAASMDYPVETLRADFCATDPLQRARAWQAVYDYFGWHEGDAYPLTFTRAEVEARYPEFA